MPYPVLRRQFTVVSADGVLMPRQFDALGIGSGLGGWLRERRAVVFGVSGGVLRFAPFERGVASLSATRRFGRFRARSRHCADTVNVPL